MTGNLPDQVSGSFTEREMDHEEFLHRISSSLSVLEAIQGQFLHNCPELYRQVRANLDKSPEEAARAAHSLKGMLLNLSAYRVAGIAQEIEERSRQGQVDRAKALMLPLHKGIGRVRQELHALVEQSRGCSTSSSN